MWIRLLVFSLIFVLSCGVALADPKGGHKGNHKKDKWEHKKHKKKWKHGKGKHGRGNPHYVRGDAWEPGGWAYECGLPPGLKKQGKVPPGWQKKCRNGKKYYEHEEEYTREVYRTREEHDRIAKNSGKKSSLEKSSEDYETIYAIDDAACKVKALKSAGNVAEGLAKGAIYGGILGAIGGAVYEGTQEGGSVQNGAIYGGVGGASGGAVLGGVQGSDEFKKDHRQCMRKKGHSVKN